MNTNTFNSRLTRNLYFWMSLTQNKTPVNPDDQDLTACAEGTSGAQTHHLLTRRAGKRMSSATVPEPQTG